MPLLDLLFVPAAFIQIADTKIEQACAGRKKEESRIELIFDEHPIDYDYSLSVAQLNALSKNETAQWTKRHGHNRMIAAIHTRGLTQGALEYQVKSSLSGRLSGLLSMTFCPHMKTLTVMIGYSSKIYIARDFRKGTCEYREIWRHEQLHHKANLKSAREFVAKLEEDLPAIITYAEKKSIMKGSADDAMIKLNDYMQDAVKFYSGKAQEKMKERNALIDTPEEYERAARACR